MVLDEDLRHLKAGLMSLGEETLDTTTTPAG